MSDSLAVLPQYLLPKKALTVFAGWVAGAKGGALTTALIRWFVKRYNVTMAEAQEPDVAAYASFNDFFTRALKPGARPLAAAHYLCPVDGAISQFGTIAGDQIFQAKGHRYSTTALVGGDAALAAQFQDGSFATLYLSPRDYHRIHMPCDGNLRRMVYVPGDLFSVNPTTARGVPGLFARNERVVCVFDSADGPFVLTLVGATIVGSMATVWHGQVNPPGRPKGKRAPSGGREPHAVGERGGQASPARSPQICEWQYTADQVVLRKGEEMGRFLLGSTVVMLFGKDRLAFNPDWSAARPVRMGEAMGNSA